MLESRQPKKRRNILLVEDDLAHAELIQRCLQDCPDAQVEHVWDGEEALNCLVDRPSGPAPDLILLDLRLPKVPGDEVLRRIRAEKRLDATPVVVLSSSQAEEDKLLAYRHCANSYLIKPMDFCRYQEMTAAITDYWLRWNSSPDPSNAKRSALQ